MITENNEIKRLRLSMQRETNLAKKNLLSQQLLDMERAAHPRGVVIAPSAMHQKMHQAAQATDDREIQGITTD